MKVSVVIPARNEAGHIREQLDAVLAQRCDVEWDVIVVDNGSTDDTAEIVRAYGQRSPRVRHVLATEKADQSYAANVGVAASDADAVVFCDADDIVVDGWLSAMAAALEVHDVVTGPNLLDRLNPPWLAGSRGRSIEEPVGTFFGLFPLVRGNNYGVRREVWDVTGPLAEDLSRHGVLADQEFSLRCWLHGVDVVGVPEAAVHYRYRASARALWRQGFAYGSHRPMIARMLRDLGRPRPPRLAGWRSWLLLVLTVPTIVTRPGRARWLWIAGNRLGQVVGSVRYRTLML